MGVNGAVTPAGGGDSAAVYLPWFVGNVTADHPACSACSWTVQRDALGGGFRWALKIRHRRCPQHGDGLGTLAAEPLELDDGEDE